jgi:hypothetical protein
MRNATSANALVAFRIIRTTLAEIFLFFLG